MCKQNELVETKNENLVDKAFVNHIISCKKKNVENGSEDCKGCNVKDLCDYVCKEKFMFCLEENNKNNSENKTGEHKVKEQDGNVGVEKVIDKITERDIKKIQEGINQIFDGAAKILLSIAKYCYEDQGNEEKRKEG